MFADSSDTIYLMALLGIFFAVAALVSWGFGDFFIQRATRQIGVWRTLFFIDFAAALFFLPFIYEEIGPTFSNGRGMFLLTAAGLVIFLAALLIFKSYKDGKLAIVEPILAFELPVVVALGIFTWGEKLSVIEILLIGSVFLGIVLAITKHHTHLHYHKRIFERGVVWAVLGAIVMGLGSFLLGVSSQETSPLFTMWYTSLISVILCLFYMVPKGEVKKLINDLRAHKKSVISQVILDNAAWTFYAFSMTLIPISIATTISESYIALSVVLGIVVNHEKIQRHQKIGVALAIAGVIFLGMVTGK
ncbi:MAG: Uncharacterized protein G01um101420_710 [Parcubacteria group bacterium Gr01-1014_20]|nr:MAG: Uncharacterized protein G01um101420_710 [Parcubacteria group bacterium Gr01-1014_20]